MTSLTWAQKNTIHSNFMTTKYIIYNNILNTLLIKPPLVWDKGGVQQGGKAQLKRETLLNFWLETGGGRP
jgi:hypothetical protein